MGVGRIHVVHVYSHHAFNVEWCNNVSYRGAVAAHELEHLVLRGVATEIEVELHQLLEVLLRGFCEIFFVVAIFLVIF